GVGMHGVAFAANLASARTLSHEYQDVAAIAKLPQGIDVSNTPSPQVWPAVYAQMARVGTRLINFSTDLDPVDPGEEGAAQALEHRRKMMASVAEGARSHGMIHVWAAGNDSAKPLGDGAMLAAT